MIKAISIRCLSAAMLVGLWQCASAAALVIDTDGHTSLFVDPVRIEPTGSGSGCKKVNSMVTTGSGSSAIVSDGRVYVDKRDCEDEEESGSAEAAPAKPAKPEEPKSILKHYQ